MIQNLNPADQLITEFGQALTRAIAGTELENASRLGLSGTGMPWLALEGAQGGYWVGIGLEQWPRMRPERCRTFLFLSYVSDDEDDPLQDSRPLDVYLTGQGARDAELLAALVVHAALRELCPDTAAEV